MILKVINLSKQIRINQMFDKIRHGVKVGPGPRDPPQSLKVGPGTPLKFKSGTLGPPSKFKSRTPGPPSKFKSGTLIITFLHCLTYFVLDK